MHSYTTQDHNTLSVDPDSRESIREPIREPILEESYPQPFEAGLFNILVTVGRRRWRIALVTLAAAVLSTIVVLFIPNQYTAATLVLPPAQTSSMSSALMSQLGGSGALASVAGAGLGLKNPGDMYVSLFRSRTVEDAVIQRFGLIARYHAKHIIEARTAFEDRSTVLLGVKDNLIRITVRDRDPNFAANVANGYVDEFHKLSANLAITEASQRRAFFQQQLLEANGNLANAEQAMKQTQQSTGILQIDSQARSLIESAAQLRAQVAAKEVQLQAMRTYATESNPDLIRAKDQLAALQTQLARLSGNGGDSGTDFIVPKGKVPEANMEYLRKLRDLKYSETIAELIAKQFEAAKLDEARQGAIVQIVDVAVPPDTKSSPHRLLIVLLATLIACIASVVWVISADRWKQYLNDPIKSSRIQAVRNSFSNRQHT